MNPQYAAINSGSTINLAVMTIVGKGEQTYPAITSLISTTSIDQIKAKISDSQISSFSYIANQADGENTTDVIIYITDRFSVKGQLEQTKTELSISNDYSTDCFNFKYGAMFCALLKETAQNIEKTLKDFHTGSTTINSLELAITNLYLRVYEQNNCTAILHFSDSQISVVVVEKVSPIWVAALNITNNDHIATAVKLLTEFRASIPSISIERILLCGDATKDHLETLEQINRTKSIVVEFFNPLTNNFINTSLLSQTQLTLLEREGHRFVGVVGGALNGGENSGVDLSSNQQLLVKSFTEQPVFHIPFNLTNTLVEVTNTVKTKVLAAATSQSKIIGLGLITALVLVGYNYYDTNNKLIETESSIVTETTIATQLKPFQDRYKEYQQKLTVKNNEISQIREIQKTQLTIPTILDEIQRAQSPLQQLVNFSSIEIEGRNLHVAGNAIDKAQTIDLLDKLRTSSTSRFLDINPTYSSNDIVRCEFSFTASYGGPVQVNPIKLPIPTTTSNQVAQMSSNK